MFWLILFNKTKKEVNANYTNLFINNLYNYYNEK